MSYTSKWYRGDIIISFEDDPLCSMTPWDILDYNKKITYWPYMLFAFDTDDNLQLHFIKHGIVNITLPSYKTPEDLDFIISDDALPSVRINGQSYTRDESGKLVPVTPAEP